jgi:hypothetical protein
VLATVIETLVLYISKKGMVEMIESLSQTSHTSRTARL